MNDASSHVKGEKSLNMCQYPGPNLLNDLAGILLRFRATNEPVLADLEKAFLMIALLSSDREFVKFLWVKNPNLPLKGNNIQVFRFARIPFGILSSPFILFATLLWHLDHSSFPLAQEIKNNLYSDNLLIESQTVKEANEKAKTAQKIFTEAKFRLREFFAKSPKALEGIEATEIQSNPEPTVLGLKWNLKSDCIIFNLPEKFEGTITRRSILSQISSFFDPLGICCPIMLEAKLFFQTLWDLNLKWDDPISQENIRKWEEIEDKFSGQIINFPRHVPIDNAQNVTLHIFSDASPNAFSAVAYIRAEISSQIYCSIIYGRSRLRPKKMNTKEDGLSIPRMELLGLLIATRIKKFILTHLKRPIHGVYFWCDSQIVLSWVGSSIVQPVFVQNRLSEIRKHRENTFRYASSIDNPADLATKFCSPKDLQQSNLWFNGPNWLKMPPSGWPHENEVKFPPEENLGISIDFAPNPPFISAAIAVDQPIIPFEKFSTWSALIHFVDPIVRALHLMGNKNSTIMAKLPKNSKEFIIRIIQLGMTTPHPTYLDNNKIVRLKGRIGRASVSIEFRHPAVLPTKSWATLLIIRRIHHQFAHAGVDFTLNEFFNEYYCKNARKLVRKIIFDCPVCKRDRAYKFPLPNFPDLPESRVRPSTPFEHIGLDYLGPTLYKTESEGPQKAWVL